jgi:hypothetical protein
MYLERHQQINKYKIKKKLDKYQNTLSNLLIIGFSCENIKIPQRQKLFFLYLFQG